MNKNKKDKILLSEKSDSTKSKKFTLENLIAGITKSNIHKEVNTGKKVGAEFW